MVPNIQYVLSYLIGCYLYDLVMVGPPVTPSHWLKDKGRQMTYRFTNSLLSFIISE